MFSTGMESNFPGDNIPFSPFNCLHTHSVKLYINNSYKALLQESCFEMKNVTRTHDLVDTS